MAAMVVAEPASAPVPAPAPAPAPAAAEPAESLRIHGGMSGVERETWKKIKDEAQAKHVVYEKARNAKAAYVRKQSPVVCETVGLC